MRRMAESGWKIAVVSALLVVGSYLSLGQAPDGPPPPEGAPPARMEREANPERQLGMLTRMLNLTADQQKGVRTVLEQQATEMKALREKAPADPATGQRPETRETRMAQMNQIREESNTKIAALLDEGQKKTYAGWVKKGNESRERHRGGAAPDEDGPPPPKE